MHTWDADSAEIGKSLDRITTGLEPTGENVSVLERLAGALPGIGQHGVRRIANELNAAAAPIFCERTREQTPFGAGGHKAKELREPRLWIGKAQPHLVGITASRPAFLDPFVCVLLGNDIHEVSLANVIRNEMAAGAETLRMAHRFHHSRRHIAAVEEGTPHHLPRIDR